MENPDDGNSLVKSISKEELGERESQVTGRMKRKLLALRKLFDNGEGIVYISDGRTENPVMDALNGKGTIIK